MLQYLVPGENGSVAAGRRRRHWVWYRRVAAGAALAELLTGRDGVRHASSLPPGAVRPDEVASLRSDAAGLLAPALRALVDATDEPCVQAVVDLAVPRMVFGRAVLLGDAAFVPRPHTAGSTAKAAADAAGLAQALEGVRGDAVDAALAGWQAKRLREGAAMTAWGRAAGDRLMGLAGGAGAPRGR